MYAIGLVVTLSGFAGVPGFLIAGVSGSMAAGICTQAALICICVILLIRQAGGVRAWLGQASGAEYGMPPWVVSSIGLLFAIWGLYFIVYGRPTNNEQSMTRAEIVYFGANFMLLGCGIGMMSRADSAEAASPDDSYDPFEVDQDRDDQVR